MSQKCAHLLRAAFLVLGGAILLSAQPAAEQAPAPAAVTFTKDIAPIFQKNCQQCHQPDAIGPMSLTTYEEVAPVGARDQAEGDGGRDAALSLRPQCRHPAAEARPAAERGRDPDDRSLGRQRRAAGQSRPTCRRRSTFPDPNEWAFAKQFGPPDVIVKTKPFTLPAAGQDVWWRPIVPTGLTKDRCIKAISVKPSRRAAPRRITPTASWSCSTRRPAVRRDRARLRVRARQGRRDRSARRLPHAAGQLAGPVGRSLLPDRRGAQGRRDRDGHLALSRGHQAKYKQDLKLYSLLMKGGELEIPPHGTAMTQGFHSFKTPVRIDSFQPHGHFRLVGKTLEIFYPETGKLEMVSSVSNWTNNWHTSHIYEDDAAPLVPKGAVLVITGYYDNTAATRTIPIRISGSAPAAAPRTRCRTPGSRSRISTTRATRGWWRSARAKQKTDHERRRSSRRGSSRRRPCARRSFVLQASSL